ncbi:MAG: AraC family transcriptional regulator [Abitibacteriaceae bacterium]|nr:AraC family transcriptional regulator [Abditibacteriaceae bacterium]
MDVLTDVLQTVHLRSALWGRAELTAPWGLQHTGGDGVVLFHYVLRGHGWLEMDSLPQPESLTGGDLVVLPQSHSFTLRNDLATLPRPMEELWNGCPQANTSSPASAPPVVQYGGGGAPTTLVSGCFHFDNKATNPLLAALPPLIHIKAEDLQGENRHGVPWLETTLQFIACEIAVNRPGAQTVISRLSDVLFIQAIRAFIAHAAEPHGASRGNGQAKNETCGNWLRALAEPQIGMALGLIHAQPDQPWTVASLASHVGMSRSAFAVRFAQLVGEPPLQYITRWRMHKATDLLRHGSQDLSLAQVATSVGYEAEAAFSKAFKRMIGESPGAYRRAAVGAR